MTVILLHQDSINFLAGHLEHFPNFLHPPSPPPFNHYIENVIHKRRIKTEEKAKVVAVVWGTELIQFLVELDILHRDDLKKGMNS